MNNTTRCYLKTFLTTIEITTQAIFYVVRDDSLRLIKSTWVVNTSEKMKKYGVSFWKNEHDLEISCTFAVCIFVSYVLRNDSLLFQTKSNKDWPKIRMPATNRIPISYEP